MTPFVDIICRTFRRRAWTCGRS